MKPIPLTASPCLVPFSGNSIRAGFPSPCENVHEESLDVSKQLIQHPQATFFFRVVGESMIGAGIHHGDYVVVDRAIKPEPGHIVVAVVDGCEFTIKYLRGRSGKMWLEAANPTYPAIRPKDGQTIEVWGVATNCIHPLPGSARWV